MEPSVRATGQRRRRLARRRMFFAAATAAALVADPVLAALVPNAGAALAEGNPLVAGGMQVGERMQRILDDIQTALDGVTDAASAQTAVESFSTAERRILELEPFMLLLPHQGKSAIAAQVTGAMIVMKPSSDKLSADAAIGPVFKPGFDKLVAKFKSLG